MRKFFSLMAAILFAGSMMATQETIFTYNGKGVTDAESIEKAGGTLTVYGQNTNIVADQKQKGNMCIKINKGYFKDGIYYYMAITLDEPLQAGDQIQTAAFRTGSNSCVYGMDFNAVADSASASDACQVLFPDNLQILSSNGVPVDTTFTIPEEAAGARFIRLYRKSGSTGLWIANFTILRGEGGGDDPQPEPELADGYYLVGTMNEWTPAAEYKFEANPANENEMMLAGVNLAENAELKVRQVENGEATVWFPAEAGNYVVDAAHAGEKDIYFRADGQGGEGWHYGYIYIAENVEPEPVDPNQMYIWDGVGTTTAEDAIELGGAAEAVQPSGENIVIGIAQRGNWCIKINKKFDNGNYYAGVALDNAVNAGDTLKVAYFRTGASSTYVMGIDFSADKASVATTYQILTEGDPQVLESAGTPADSIFIVPEGVANAKYIRFYRNSGSTGVWIAKIAIAKKSGETPEPQPEPELANGYYLVGDQYNWTPAAERMFAVNPGNEAEMMLTGVTLATDDSLKVVYVENDAIVTWFPAEAGNYVVDAAHAGEKDIYFRADYQGGEGWYAGCIYIAENVEPQPEPENLWKVTEATEVAAGTVYLDNDLLKLESVYAGVLVGNERTFGNITFTHAVCVRVEAWPTTEVPTGTQNTKGTPLVLTAKENATITLYYHRQAVSGAYAENDNKDLVVYDQADLSTKLTGVFTMVAETEAGAYATATKELELVKGHVYTICCKGTTIQLHGMMYEAGEPEPLADGYYLVGDFAGEAAWNPVAERMLVANPANENEMMLAGFALAVDDSLKVVYVENGAIANWFPAEAGNYVVDADHAGLKDIYFRADYQGGEGWYAGCIYIAANSGTAIINTEAAKVAVKQLRNGMVIIRRGDREYSIMGQLVK